MHVFLLHGKVHAARRASGLCPVMFCFVGSCGFVGFVGAPASGLVVVTLVSLPCLSHRWTTGSGCGTVVRVHAVRRMRMRRGMAH